MGLYDQNRLAQDFFAKLFKLVYGYKNLQELDKLNEITNYPAIDLGDPDAKVAIQITSQNDGSKITKTIEKFIEHKLYESYDHLIIFIIGDKQAAYRAKFDTKSKFAFDREKDIWDDKHLAKAIDKISEIQTLEEIEKLLSENLSEYAFPERLFDDDIEKCIWALAHDVGEILEENPSARPLPNRNDDFIERKNALNHLSWDFYKDKIRGHLPYNAKIDEFLRNPINIKHQQCYLTVTNSIQKEYEQHRDQYTSFEDVFKKVFNNLPRDYENGINETKVKILLHNMYFNCDIGDNPNDDSTK